ncbi:MAG TPA: GtrA family protein [Actinomycetota bacterium]|nr:GtrA family protein [Actinomycetota bacterium]
MLARRLDEARRKQLRYLVASAASLTVAQAVLVLTFGIAGWTAVTANVASFVVATAFAYVIQRRWTWRRTDRSDVWREVVPFWAMAGIGLAASTIAVRAAAAFAEEHVASRLVQTLAVVAASTATYGVLWVAKFLILERFLFGRPAPGRTSPEIDREAFGAPREGK